MQTMIQSRDFELTTALKNFIQQQALKSMSSCESQIERLTVRLKDINGPKGGNDKECCVEVKLAHTQPIVIKKRSNDTYGSIHSALNLASKTVLRKMGKRKKHMKHMSVKHLAEVA